MEKILERESEKEIEKTPNRDKKSTSLSTFEDSPVFNYINNLSPLETAPLRLSQNINPYSFSSVPSVFTSPHVSSLKDTTFLRRHFVSGPSNPTCSLENRNKICSNGGFVDIAQSEAQEGSFDPGGGIHDRLKKGKVENETLQNQNYGCHGRDASAVTRHGIDAKDVSSKLCGSSNSFFPFGQGGFASGFVSNKEHYREGGSFGGDAADYLLFESPDNANPFKRSFLKPLDSDMRVHLCEETQDGRIVGVETNGTENTVLQNGEGQLNATEGAGDVLADTSLNNKPTNEAASNLPRGIRRRCLVYDTGGARRRLLDDGATSSSSGLSACHITSSENRTSIANVDRNPSQCLVPSIGLHLNALATEQMACTANNQVIVAPQRQLINDPSTNPAPDLFVNTRGTVNPYLTLNSVSKDVSPIDVGVPLTEAAYQLSEYIEDDLNQSSQKKPKVENGGEGESCKRCNCKKSKCLKLYCECFAAGVYCVEPCSCIDCFNKPIHEDTVLATRKQIESRNPLAFAPKVIRTPEFVPETAAELSSTPASARHKRGCNCKKSGCLKKYCECFQGGVGCSINCRCEGCKNAFGRKDGSRIVPAEAEVEVMEKREDRNLSKHIIQNNAEPSLDSILLETPTHSNRAPLQHPISSKTKLPRSLLSKGSSSSTLYSTQKIGIPASSQQKHKFENRVPTSSGAEMPEILRSPVRGIKSSSPNSKRVSPHKNFGSSLSPARSSRKLLLQSIPSFPSLKD